MNKTIATEQLSKNPLAGVPSVLSQWSDEDLLDRYCSHGDPKVFGVLVHRYGASFTAICADTWGTPRWPRMPSRVHFYRYT